eukprot:gene4572-4788_t
MCMSPVQSSLQISSFPPASLTASHRSHLVSCMASEVENGQAMIAMEFCGGGSLMDLMKQFEVMPNGMMLAMMRQILLGQDGLAKLADFGCASILPAGKSRTISAKGTTGYMAPECMSGQGSFPCDIWSFGLTALHLATGSPPWNHLHEQSGYNLNDLQIVFQVTQGLRHPIPEQLPAWIRFMVENCLELDPKLRWNSNQLFEYLQQDASFSNKRA